MGPDFVVMDHEGHRRNDKEVHSSDAARMVLKKSLPTLGGVIPGLGTILPDGCRRGYQRQFGQFFTDARAAPSRIGIPHLPLSMALSS